ISPYLKRYEGLSYDRAALHRRHLRARRAAGSQENALNLDFTAFHRTFRLHLKHDSGAFSENFTVMTENGPISADLSHMYSGRLEGERDSACYGSVFQGQFEGTITGNDTYHIEPIYRYSHSETDHHSIIYQTCEQDYVIYPASYLPTFNIMPHSTYNLSKSIIASSKPEHVAQLPMAGVLADGRPHEAAASRSRRTVDQAKTSCLLHLHADHLYYKRFKTVEAVVAQVNNSKKVKGMHVFFYFLTAAGLSDRRFLRISHLVVSLAVSPLKLPPPTVLCNVCYIKFICIHESFKSPRLCKAKDIEHHWRPDGVSALVWNRSAAGNWGGICSKPTTLQNGETATLNTGLVTIQNYGQFLPSYLVQLTIAHELGHSLGSPHDEGSNCGNLGSVGGKGRYLMFPHASDGVHENNDKLSPCSIARISEILQLKKDECFLVSDHPICGNQIVEEGEQCDVGHNDEDLCCYSAKQPAGVQCYLKPEKKCSPSQGLCCGQDCGFKPAGWTCDEETDCQRASVCSGLSPYCPEPSAKENLTVCSLGTRVCLNGVCTQSVCVKHSLQQCDCPGGSAKEKCHMCCQQPDKPDTCASTSSSVLSHHFQKKLLPLVGGAPCSQNQGYCDKFHVCRLLDADGPIARLKNSILHLDDFEDLGDWMKAHWWALLLAILTLTAVMGCTICLCS
uniref:ADAM10 endopeptidase n=1 Tax=Tetraodon nigroviridis TaxID=99883 RepID=H3DDF0_TETNG